MSSRSIPLTDGTRPNRPRHAKASAFTRLGLTDAALLEVVSPETPLPTVDLDLYLEDATRDHRAAVNVRHLQPL